MAVKGQKFKYYPESLKLEALRLRLEEGWSYPKITKQLNIHDKDRIIKKWMQGFIFITLTYYCTKVVFCTYVTKSVLSIN